MHSTLEAVRAEALFASTMQPSDLPTPDDVRHTVTQTLRRLRAKGCAIRVAGEFGDHPDTAPARMTWALSTVRAVSRSAEPPQQARLPRQAPPLLQAPPLRSDQPAALVG